MIYGNIYDPEYRNKLLLKELKIAGQDDDDTNDNPDYTADDTNNQTDGGQEDGTQDTGEAPADNTADDGGTLALGDDNDPNPDYTVDDTEGGNNGQGPAPDTQDAGGDNGGALDMAAGDNTDGNPDYTADDTEGEGDTGDTGGDAGTTDTGGDSGTLDMAAGGDDGGDNPDYTADDTEGGGDAGDAGTTNAGGDGGTLDMAAGDGGGNAGGGDNPDYTDDGVDGGDDGGNTDGTANTDDTTDGGDTGDDGQDPSQYDFGVDDQAKAIKNLELKQNYQQMYIACDDILTKISTITNYSDASGILRRVVNMANDLKKYIEFYLTNTYNTKSYIDNVVNFQKYLTILNGIRNVLKDTNEGTEKDNKIEESVVSLFRSIV